MTTSPLTAQKQMEWVYPDKAHDAYILRAGGAEVGSLRFQEGAGTTSAAEFEGRRWTFAHSGDANPTVTIRSADSGELVAEFVPNLTGGTVSFRNGPCFTWTRLHVWGSRWCFRCKEDRSAVCVSQEAGRLAGGGKVSVCEGAAQLPATPVLVMLAWYLRILEFERLATHIPMCC
jgi:hypothetical protein